MKKGIFSIKNAGKKRVGIVILCVTLIAALGTGLVACGTGRAQTLPVGNSSPSETKSVSKSSAAVGDIIQLGGLDWRVLEVKDGNALVLSDKVLLEQQFHLSDRPMSWEGCSLREYLNGDFYDDTFSEEEKERIIETALINNDNPWYITPGGNDTTDKVFLLSIDEMLQYFGDSGTLDNRPSGATYITDQFDEARMAQTKDGEALWWWLRSPGIYYFACEANHTCAATVNAGGGLSVQGNLVNNVGGVRPALWLML